MRHKHFSALRQAIATSGGTEVKNLGDGLMVVFPAASAALNCAVAMQQAVHRDNAGAEQSTRAAGGIELGRGDAGRTTTTSATRSSRRPDCAPEPTAGRSSATDLVRAIAGRRSAHTFTSLGELELKGLPEPIETLQVAWEPLESRRTSDRDGCHFRPA